MTMKTLKRSISLARRYVFLFCFMSLIGGLRVLQKAKQKRQTKRKVVSQVIYLMLMCFVLTYMSCIVVGSQT